MYSIGEAAAFTGVSIRTLRYYDKIGLLKPAEVSESGYRYYTQKELAELQVILFYRELEFSLEEIKHLLSVSEELKTQALEKHIKLLLLKRERLDGLILLAQQTLGGKIMTNPKTTAAEIDKIKARYAEEIREKWGNTPQFEQSERRFFAMSSRDKDEFAAETDEIFSEFAECAMFAPTSEKVRSAVRKWYDFICRNCFDCDMNVFLQLGQMYVGDERFKKNLDRYGEGTAQIMSRGIEVFVRENA